MTNGINLWNAVDLIGRAWKEIEAMEADLSKKMAEQLKHQNFNSVAGEPAVDQLGDKSVRYISISQWGIKPKGKGQGVCGNLSVQVVLWSEDDESGLCDQIPRVEVGYISYAEGEKIDKSYQGTGTWFTQEYWQEVFPKSGDKYACWPKSVKSCKGVRWDERANWVFAIPLLDIHSDDEIGDLIIKPAIGLLTGKDSEHALKGITTIRFALGKDGVLLSTPV